MALRRRVHHRDPDVLREHRHGRARHVSGRALEHRVRFASAAVPLTPRRLWYPTIQFTFRYVEPSKDIHIWKSTAVTSWVSAPSAALDKRSCKSDQFSITLDPATPNRYTIEGKYDADVQISLVYEKLADGWKLGAGPRGGMTYFGTLAAQPPKGPAPDLTSGADGYAIHRFWPRCAVSGIMRVGTDVVDLADARGIFVHAVQGMRPNILAAKWNFANFQSSAAGGQGVSLTMMEFTTTPAYGSQTINVGSVVVGDKLVAVTAGSALAGVGSHAKHLASVLDAETEYEAPGQIAFAWEGQTLGEAGKSTNATLLLDLATSAPGAPYTTRGLVEKVDVLGQIPYLLKKFVNYAAGTKPYIYTVRLMIRPCRADPAVAERGVRDGRRRDCTRRALQRGDLHFIVESFRHSCVLGDGHLHPFLLLVPSATTCPPASSPSSKVPATRLVSAPHSSTAVR